MKKNLVSASWMAVLLVAGAATVAFGEPGDGIRVGDMLVRPFVDLSLNYDSNPLLLPKGQESDDFFLDANPGLNVMQVSDVMQLDGIFWGRFRRYDDLTSQNHDDLSEELRLILGRAEDWRLRLNERFGRISDYDVAGVTAANIANQDTTPLSMNDRSERVDRNILDAGFGVQGPLTDKMSLDALFDYGKVNYINPNLFDSTEEKVSVKAGRNVTDKSSVILVGDYIRMENDSLPDPDNYYALRAGWQWQGTDKSRFEGSLGYYSFAYTDQNSSDTRDRGGVSYNVAWYWQAFSKLLISVDGRNEMQLSADTPNDARLSSLITSSARYSVTERTSLALLLGYRNDRYDLADNMVDGELVKREANQLHVGLRCDRSLRKWLKVYGEAWREDTQDNVRGDYNEVRATLGMKAEY